VLDYDPDETIESIRDKVAGSTRPPTISRLVALKYGTKVLLDGTSLRENGVPPGGRILAALLSGGHQSSLAHTSGGHASAAAVATVRKREEELRKAVVRVEAERKAEFEARVAMIEAANRDGTSMEARIRAERDRWSAAAAATASSGSGGKGGGGARGGSGGGHHAAAAHHGSGGAGRGGASAERDAEAELLAAVSPNAAAASLAGFRVVAKRLQTVVRNLQSVSAFANAGKKYRATQLARAEASAAKEERARLKEVERAAAERRAMHLGEHRKAVAEALEDSHARYNREIDNLLDDITTGIATLQTGSGGEGGGEGGGGPRRSEGDGKASRTAGGRSGKASRDKKSEGAKPEGAKSGATANSSLLPNRGFSNSDSNKRTRTRRANNRYRGHY